MFADLAIAKKCNTALVDPPKAMTNEIAFSIDFFEIISSGLISLIINFSMDFPILPYPIRAMFIAKFKKKILVRTQVLTKIMELIE